MPPHTKRLLAMSFAIAALASLPALGELTAETDPTRPFVVKVHADWCGTCVRLNPVWERLEAEYGEMARLVVFDVTDRRAVERSRRDAERLGLLAFFDAHKSKTGTVGILHGGTRETVGVFKGELDLARYQEALEAARGAQTS